MAINIYFLQKHTTNSKTIISVLFSAAIHSNDFITTQNVKYFNKLLSKLKIEAGADVGMAFIGPVNKRTPLAIKIKTF